MKPPKINGLKQVRVETIREAPFTFGDAAEPYRTGDSPDKIAAILESIFEADPTVETERENFFVILLSTRRKILGWQHVSVGTLDTILVHPREIFRAAIVGNAAAIVRAHNHPSGDPTPSESDIRATRDAVKAGQILKIEVVDHVIVGNPVLRQPGSRGWASLKELGYFYA